MDKHWSAQTQPNGWWTQDDITWIDSLSNQSLCCCNTAFRHSSYAEKFMRGRTMRACRFWSLCRLLEHCELISLLILTMTTKAKKRGGVKKGLLKLLGIGYYYGKSEVQTAHPSPKACILTPLFNVSISCKPEYVHERSTVWQMNTNWFQQSRNTDRVNFKQLNGW